MMAIRSRYGSPNRITPFFLLLLLSACSSSEHQVSYITEPNVEAASAPIYRSSQLDSDLKHFVEFRAEMNVFPGHSYLVYGLVNGRGEIAKQSAPIGFYPHLGPVAGITLGWIAAPGTIEPDESEATGELKEKYRVLLTPEQHARLLKYIAGWRGQTVAWNLFLQNCNDFATGAAKAIGLKTPRGLGFTLPYVHVRKIRDLNPT
jgi:hypothetical protein